MAGTTAFAWIVAACSALLRAVTRHHGGVQIQGEAVDGDLSKQPLIQGIHHGFVGALSEFIEEPHDRLKVGHAFKAEQALQDWIVAGDFSMFKAIGATPYREHELGDELFRAIAAITTGVG